MRAFAYDTSRPYTNLELNALEFELSLSILAHAVVTPEFRLSLLLRVYGEGVHVKFRRHHESHPFRNLKNIV